MAKKRTASMEVMEDLHAATVREVTDRIVGYDEEIPAEFDGEGKEIKPARVKRVRASAAELAVARALLKDNSIFSAPEIDDNVANMQAALQRHAQGRKPTPIDKADALAMVGQDLLQ